MFLSDYKHFPVAMPMAGSSGDPDSIGYVYVVGFSEADIVKIGCTTCTTSRLDALQTSNPFELHLRAAVSIYSGDPFEVEKQAHRLATVAGQHIRGEWFDISVDDALRCIIEAAKLKRVKYGPWSKAVKATLDDAKDRGASFEAERLKKLQTKLGMA